MYIELTDENAKEIEEEYSLLGPLSYFKINGGLSNSNYKITTSDNKDYMLKILGCINEEQMETQAKILKLVSSHSVKTSLAISSSKRENFHSFRSNIDPQKLFSLYHFLPGKGGIKDNASNKQVEQMAIELAKLHLIPSSDYLHIPLNYFQLGFESFCPFINSYSNSPLSSHPFYLYTKEKTELLLKMIPKDDDETSSLHWGILHADLFTDNVIFNEEEELLGVVDFEEVAKGVVILDVAMTVSGTCYRGEKLDFDLLSTFLRAYQSLRPLPDHEKKLLFYYLQYAILAMAFWRFKQFNIVTSIEGMENHYVSLWNRMKDCENLQTEIELCLP